MPITIRSTMGAGRSSAAQHSQSLHAWLAPIVRLGAMDVPVPFSKPLEDATIPTPEDVIKAVQDMKIR